MRVKVRRWSIMDTHAYQVTKHSVWYELLRKVLAQATQLVAGSRQYGSHFHAERRNL